MSRRRRIPWLVAGALVLCGSHPLVRGDEETPFKDESAGLAVWFPSQPAKASATYRLALTGNEAVTVPALIYSAQDQSNAYSVTIANLKGTVADQPGAINFAVAAARGFGDVKLDLETSVAGSACGRDLTVLDRDGARSVYAVFFQSHANHALYVFRAKSLSASTIDAGASDALRFQQSVDFIGPAATPDPPETADDRRWKRYFYYPSRFSMRFPSQPSFRHGTYETAGGVKVSTVVYTARQGKTGFYRVTIADLWHTPADQLDAIDQAVQVLGKSQAIASVETVNIQGGQCGRDLKFADRGHASALSTVIFPTVSHWLYIIEARASTMDSARNAADLSRFRRSLRLYWKTDGSIPN